MGGLAKEGVKIGLGMLGPIVNKYGVRFLVALGGMAIVGWLAHTEKLTWPALIGIVVVAAAFFFAGLLQSKKKTEGD